MAAAAARHPAHVSAGRGVFDGNVKVNRLAQKTDAGQLSRNLLLVPRATVNVKPNLQIIADDVKCTHGCAISDLEEDELFYFASRGIDKDTARQARQGVRVPLAPRFLRLIPWSSLQALVYSFGLEVVNQIEYQALRDRIARAIKAKLASFEAGLKSAL